MRRQCDHTSVGVIIYNQAAQLALVERRNFPPGMAPPAGHVDAHGSVEQAAYNETREETGLEPTSLQVTDIQNRRVDNPCSREGGDYHEWTIFRATVGNVAIAADPGETKGGDWYDQDKLQALADRTRAYLAGKITVQEWVEQPGLEPVWLDFLVELGDVV